MSQPVNYPIANLSTIRVSDLRNGSPSAANEVVRAAKQDGVFYLDFADSKEFPCTDIIRDVQAFSRELFQLGFDQKMEFDVDRLAPFKTNGYTRSSRPPMHELMVALGTSLSVATSGGLLVKVMDLKATP
jgi:isopenicillin N synthase-like dioxygenase